MSEQQAATPTDAAPEPSWDDRLANVLGLSEPEQVTAPPEAEQATPEGELAPEEIEQETPTEPEGEWLELDRKGEKRKVSKEEAKRLAQQGWDYSTNQEQLKAERQSLAQEKAAIQARAQITPRVIDAAGNVKMYERALSQYQTFDWVAYAQNATPQEYQAARVQFDQLKEGYQQAVGQFQSVLGQSQQIDQAAAEAALKQQFSRVLEESPELRDPKRYQAEAERVSGYLGRKGFSAQEINALADSRMFAVARDAARYADALKARAERQTQAPTLKPGTPPQRVNPEMRKQETIAKLHRTKDPAQKKALFDAALAAKLG